MRRPCSQRGRCQHIVSCREREPKGGQSHCVNRQPSLNFGSRQRQQHTLETVIKVCQRVFIVRAASPLIHCRTLNPGVGRPPLRTKRRRLTKPSTTSIIQQPHLLLRWSIGRRSRTALLLVICIAFVRVLIADPVHADEIKPGPDLIEDPVQRLFVLGVVGRRLLAL